jgi:CO/xanthine dehydrogenase Mo-binding subunit
MAYKLIGQNFVPHDVVAKVTGRAKYAEDFRADGMEDPQYRRFGSPEDAGCSRHPHRR